MTDKLVPRVRTTCTPEALFEALWADWSSVVTDAPPTRAALVVLVGHWAFETGWGQSCWNWNLGNKKHVAGDGHEFYQVRCNEVVGGVLKWYDPPDPATSFLAYDSIEAGVRDYLVGLRGRFGSAWPAVEAGDPAAFCHLLKLAHYYTDDETHYTNNVVQCCHRADLILAPAPDAIVETVDRTQLVDDQVVSVGDEKTDMPA